ncbi:MAG TPA: hypothetical protein DD490_02575 [Acidobacteria bacterium]|nr:hypothetical protein [Acidobacteriota bacterium]
MAIQPLSIAEPSTRGEIQRELQAVREWSRTFWSSFSAGEFFVPLGDAWSPADNVRHLIKSNRPVARALTLPKLLLLVRFGPGLRPSRTYSAPKTTYLEALAAGLRAGGYSPSPMPQEQQTDRRATAASVFGQDEVARADYAALGALQRV